MKRFCHGLLPFLVGIILHVFGDFNNYLLKKKAPFEYSTFTSCCNEAAENKEKQQQKLRRHNIYFANHISKITDSNDFFKL